MNLILIRHLGSIHHFWFIWQNMSSGHSFSLQKTKFKNVSAILNWTWNLSSMKYAWPKYHKRVIPCHLDKSMSPRFRNFKIDIFHTSISKKKSYLKFFSKMSPFWSRPFGTLRQFFYQKRVKFTKWTPELSSLEILYSNET
jgi:hypothetical protein